MNPRQHVIQDATITVKDTLMIANLITLELTPRQAELVLEVLREDLSRQQLISCRREESDYQRIRAIIANIKELV